MPSSKLTFPERGGFRLEVLSGCTIEALPAGGRFRLEGSPETEKMFLSTETGDGSRGVVLCEGSGEDPEERGRTTLLGGNDRAGSDGSLLLEDGRLFRIAFRRGAEPRFELTGWEHAAAYLTAVPHDGIWSIESTTAGTELEDDGVIVILFAAHLAGLP